MSTEAAADGSEKWAAVDAENAEIDALKAQVTAQAVVIKAAGRYKAMVTVAMGHQASCENSPCDACSEQMQAEDQALTDLFTSVDALPHA